MLVSVEGNIGAGKSTVLRELASRGHSVVQEPVEAWTDCNGVNLLGAFYREPKRYAYVFQSVAFLSRLSALERAAPEHTMFAERSAVSDYCFARNCFETGLLDAVEWAAYRYWWTRPVRMPDVIVYLRVAPEVCHARTQKRQRPEEAGVSLEYLQQIHEQHERWLVHGDGPCSLPRVIVSDGNVDAILAQLSQDI